MKAHYGNERPEFGRTGIIQRLGQSPIENSLKALDVALAQYIIQSTDKGSLISLLLTITNRKAYDTQAHLSN